MKYILYVIKNISYILCIICYNVNIYDKVYSYVIKCIKYISYILMLKIILWRLEGVGLTTCSTPSITWTTTSSSSSSSSSTSSSSSSSSTSSSISRASTSSSSSSLSAPAWSSWWDGVSFFGYLSATVFQATGILKIGRV